ncbi:hypothetical protein BGZ60DRAFT_409900 [Tricladium varicosporioides]|nr:hypothetical protein BGZ60DRAFT_409900 [Hymenoscyphus varicosporioides]
MPPLPSFHQQDAISEKTLLLPPQSAAPNMSLKLIAACRLPFCVVLLYFCSGYMFAILITVAYILLQFLVPLITDAHVLFFEWTFFEFLFRIWFLLWIFGISTEVLKYAGWLLMKVLREREDGGDQEYEILAARVAVVALTTILWSMDKYYSLFGIHVMAGPYFISAQEIARNDDGNGKESALVV